MNPLAFACLPLHWQRIFTLEWESVCAGSKAIAAHDRFGGAMHLMEHSAFIRSKQIEVRWAEPLLGEM
ncbi:MAG: hypothetical protein IJ060_05820 [Oscillospiraceae bacterium]|nr:hypothetical protein [Oscillospiraceae bacterium]